MNNVNHKIQILYNFIQLSYTLKRFLLLTMYTYSIGGVVGNARKQDSTTINDVESFSASASNIPAI